MEPTSDLDSVIAAQDALTKRLMPTHIEPGVLIPLKTTLELQEDHQCAQALITRSPIRSTSVVINLLRDLLPEEIVKGMPHLRRCAKPFDLPAHLKTQFMNDSPASRQIHTGKSNWVYVMLGLEATLIRKDVAEALSKVEGFEDGVFLASIPVPLVAPTSQVQAALWTSQFWPTMYRKNNPLGPHPSMVARATDEIEADAPIWMALAHDIGAKARETGFGEAMGACIVYRGSDGPQLVAIAGDARWRHQPKNSRTGNPMAHAVLRAVSMVAQKLVRAEKQSQRMASLSATSDEAAQATLPPQSAATQTAAQGVTAASEAAAGAASAVSVPETVSDTALRPSDDGAQAARQTERSAPPDEDGRSQVLCAVQNKVQDRVRDRISRNRDRGHAGHRQRLAFEPFQDKPLLEEEQLVFDQEHPTPDGYLCHGLELYVTHEPCAMCSMAILHSRMGKVIFANRMPLTGGLSAEERVSSSDDWENTPVTGTAGARKSRDAAAQQTGKGIYGLGLFWRRELNWSLLAWEWESHCICKPLPMEPTTHA